MKSPSREASRLRSYSARMDSESGRPSARMKMKSDLQFSALISSPRAVSAASKLMLIGSAQVIGRW